MESVSQFSFSRAELGKYLRINFNTDRTLDKIAHEYIHSAVSASQVKESGMLGLYIAKGHQVIYAFAEFN
jgi:hypothetical protein